MHLMLIGPRACGKTTVGRAVAAQLARPFVDLDDRALARFEAPNVADVWARHGEAAWREAEYAALVDVLAEPSSVVALGGGTPMIDAARAVLETEATAGRVTIVYLSCRPETLEARLTAEPGDRPSLTGSTVTNEVREVLAAREPTYRRLATEVVAADDGRPDTISALIARMALEERPDRSDPTSHE